MSNKDLDYTTKDYEGFRRSMIDELKLKIPEYNDFGPFDFGIILIELFASLADKLSYYNDKVANEVFIDTAKERRSIISHLDSLTYKVSNATPSRYEQVFEVTPNNNDVLIPSGTLMKVSGTSDTIYFEVIEDLLIPKNKTGIEKDDDGKYLYKTIVEHGFSVKDKIIGSSDGSSYQEFIVPDYPVIADSIMILVSNGESFDKWTKVDTFIDSNPNSLHYTVNIDDLGRAIIQFGSGLSGKIPPVIKNGIVAFYRVGGGDIGNVSPNKIDTLVSPIANVKATFNPNNALVQGIDEEDLETAKVRGKVKFRTLERAVTEDDFNEIALMVKEKNVIKSKAVIDDARSATVYVLGLEKQYSSSDLSYIQNYLNDRRIIGYTVSVANPVYVEADITIDYWKYANQVNVDLEPKIKEVVGSMFEIGKLEFGELVADSTIIFNLSKLDGISRVNVTTNYSELLPKNMLSLRKITLNYRGVYN